MYLCNIRGFVVQGHKYVTVLALYDTECHLVVYQSVGRGISRKCRSVAHCPGLSEGWGKVHCVKVRSLHDLGVVFSYERAFDSN